VQKAATLAIALLLAGCANGGSNAACVPVCDGEHEICGDQKCVCAPGYEGDPCEWGTVPKNPEFMDDGAWIPSASGVTVLPEEGLVWFDEIGVCNGGLLSQIVEMPAREIADPFVVEMVHRSESVFAVDVYANRALRMLPSRSSSFTPQRFCLGEAAYGGPIEFRIGAGERDSLCDTEPRGLLEVDSFRILEAEPGECPEPGFALNGEANPEDGGWLFDLADIDPRNGVATAALEPGVGRGETAGARLYQDGGGNLASMGTKVSVPLPRAGLGSPALRFWWKGDGLNAFAGLGSPEGNTPENPLDQLVGDGEARTNVYCLPPWTHGSVVQVWFVGLGGTSAGDLVIDDVEVVYDELCGESADVLDPTFDSAPYRWPGALSGAAGVEQPVLIVVDPQSESPSGGGGLLLQYANNNAVILFHTWVWVPPSDGQLGPTLAFHAKLPADPGIQIAGVVSRNSVLRPEDNLESGAGWQRNDYCLPASWSGRWMRFRVEVRNRGPRPPAQSFDPPKAVWLDDFELTTSAGCGR